MTVLHNGAGFACGATATMIRQGELPTTDGGVFTGVVPDGVHAVSLTFADKAVAVHAVTAAVHDNFYAVRVPGETGAAHPTVSTWLASDGRVVKTATERGVASLEKTCLKHPAACSPIGLSASSSSATTAKITPAPQPGG